MPERNEAEQKIISCATKCAQRGSLKVVVSVPKVPNDILQLNGASQW